jgi:hypothetical protein
MAHGITQPRSFAAFRRKFQPAAAGESRKSGKGLQRPQRNAKRHWRCAALQRCRPFFANRGSSQAAGRDCGRRRRGYRFALAAKQLTDPAAATLPPALRAHLQYRAQGHPRAELFKAFTRRAAQSVFPRQKIERWGFDPELLFLAKRFGIKVAEIPVEWGHSGGSRISYFRDGMRMFEEMLRVLWYAITGAYDSH